MGRAYSDPHPVEKLIPELRAASKSRIDRQRFKDLFTRTIKALEFDEAQTAAATKASIPTIRLWMSGHAAPHPVGRPSVFAELLNVAQSKV